MSSRKKKKNKKAGGDSKNKKAFGNMRSSRKRKQKIEKKAKKKNNQKKSYDQEEKKDNAYFRQKLRGKHDFFDKLRRDEILEIDYHRWPLDRNFTMAKKELEDIFEKRRLRKRYLQIKALLLIYGSGEKRKKFVNVHETKIKEKRQGKLKKQVREKLRELEKRGLIEKSFDQNYENKGCRIVILKDLVKKEEKELKKEVNIEREKKPEMIEPPIFVYKPIVRSFKKVAKKVGFSPQDYLSQAEIDRLFPSESPGVNKPTTRNHVKKNIVKKKKSKALYYQPYPDPDDELTPTDEEEESDDDDWNGLFGSDAYVTKVYVPPKRPLRTSEQIEKDLDIKKTEIKSSKSSEDLYDLDLTESENFQSLEDYLQDI